MGELINAFPERQGIKTWTDLKNGIRTIADVMTRKEEAELRELVKSGKLPENVDGQAIERYINYCYQELIPGINKNRIEAGLPPMIGPVMDSVIMGERWRLDRNNRRCFEGYTSHPIVMQEKDIPTMGEWGHYRDKIIRNSVSVLLTSLGKYIAKHGEAPRLKLVTEYYTFRDKDRKPYGFVYSVRLEEVPTLDIVVAIGEQLAPSLAEFVYRELPEGVRNGKSFEELADEQKAFYTFCVKTTLRGLGVAADRL